MCGSEVKDKVNEVADTIIDILEEKAFTLGQGFTLLRRIEQRLRDRAYSYKLFKK